MFTKSKSWPRGTSKPVEKHQVTPNGCFTVYVGPKKQRFVIKTKYVNHPLFKMLLEDAESEYGFGNGGPLQLPCEVDLFYKVLAEMNSVKEFDDDDAVGSGYTSCSPFSPARCLGKSSMAKGYGSFSLLTTSRLVKANHG